MSLFLKITSELLGSPYLHIARIPGIGKTEHNPKEQTRVFTKEAKAIFFMFMKYLYKESRSSVSIQPSSKKSPPLALISCN